MPSMALLSEASTRLPACLHWYPEILLALALFALLRRFTARRTCLPTDWPILGMLPALLSNLYRIHDFATEVLAESGCTFLLKGPWRAGMDLLVTADPANINHVFNTNFPNYPKGGEFLEIFDVLGDGIFNADDESWSAQRRMAHALMAEKTFRRFAARTTRGKVEEGLLPLLDAAAAADNDGCAVVDLHDLFLRFAFDAACMLVIGKDPGCLSAGLPAVEFADAIDTVEEVLLDRHVVPVPFWRLMRRLRLGKEARMARAWVVIDDFLYRVVAERREELCKTAEDGRRRSGLRRLVTGTLEGKHEEEDDGVSPDMLTSYLDGKPALDGKVPPALNCRSNAFLRDTALNLMVAGRDTTAAALSWFFHLVSSHSKAEGRILRELRALRPDQSHTHPVLFHPDELSPLVYLHAALLETLRLYPSVPFEHKGPVVPETLPSGHVAHPGLKVLVSLYAMGRMEGVWGADAAEFRPERWVNERGRLRHEPSYKFLAFNSGPRTCLGKDLAMNQMKAVAAALIYNYEFRPVQGHRVEPKVSIILHMKYGLKVTVCRRKVWPEHEESC